MPETEDTPGPTVNKCQCGQEPTLKRLPGSAYQVICRCGRAGRYTRTKRAAINWWNRQTAAPDYHEAAEHILNRSKYVGEGPDIGPNGHWVVQWADMLELRTAHAKAEPKS